MLYKDFARILVCVVAVPFFVATAALAANGPNTQNTSANKNEALPWNQIGAKAGADYHGDGLSVTATAAGARLHCVFQRLDADATDEGLWLASTVTNPPGDRFRVIAAAMDGQSLSPQGTVTVAGQTVRFTRPGLVEEYSVSMDGVRQDFVVTQKPAGDGELKVQLSVTGARVEQTAYGAQLVLEKSGRKLAYSRLHATDATGKELPARIVAEPDSAFRTPHSALVLVVKDAGAVYPIRIDPTFSDANWISMGGAPGTDNNGYVEAAVTDGLGDLYISGQFAVVGNVFANNIAEWNGTNWAPLGLGIGGEDPYVEALAVSGTNLYAGGYFSSAGEISVGNIAQWNGTSWSALGSGTDYSVMSLAVSGGTLYAGGEFTEAGGVPASCIAQWNGSSWSALGSGTDVEVDALLVSSNMLYAGGQFSEAGGVSAASVAQWNGSSWSGLGSGFNGGVDALAIMGTNLFVGGEFTTAGTTNANYVARWNGKNWSALGAGTIGEVSALTVSGNTLYVGGYFTTAGDVAANNIAQWNGTNWSVLGAGVNQSVTSLALIGHKLYAGGNFWTAGTVSANAIAEWNGTNWSDLGSGLNNTVSAFAVSGHTLYAGGSFTEAGGVVVNDIAQWNGTNWSALGTGMNGTVSALALSGTTLYAGGSFTTAGGLAAKCIAQWDANHWSALGSGMAGGDVGGPNVSALAVSGTTLYAGGDFTTAGGVGANYIAQWKGSTWTRLSSGMNGQVSALAMSGTTLFAGGFFTKAGSVSNCIVQWNGSTWSSPGSGGFAADFGNAPFVLALAALGTNLYVGGYFNMAGSVAATNIALWDGKSWSALGLGINSPVSALVAAGMKLFAGGSFATAEWDGSNWYPLGSGVSDGDENGNLVQALALSGDTLYVGGNFDIAGQIVSADAAEAILVTPQFQSGPVHNTNGSVSFKLLTATNWQSRLYAATNLTPPILWQPISTNLNGGAWQFVDSNTVHFNSKYYRVSTP